MQTKVHNEWTTLYFEIFHKNKDLAGTNSQLVLNFKHDMLQLHDTINIIVGVSFEEHKKNEVQ